jgi:hypothetical protein
MINISYCYIINIVEGRKFTGGGCSTFATTFSVKRRIWLSKKAMVDKEGEVCGVFEDYLWIYLITFMNRCGWMCG